MVALGGVALSEERSAAIQQSRKVSAPDGPKRDERLGQDESDTLLLLSSMSHKVPMAYFGF